MNHKRLEYRKEENAKAGPGIPAKIGASHLQNVFYTTAYQMIDGQFETLHVNSALNWKDDVNHRRFMQKSNFATRSRHEVAEVRQDESEAWSQARQLRE